MTESCYSCPPCPACNGYGVADGQPATSTHDSRGCRVRLLCRACWGTGEDPDELAARYTPFPDFRALVEGRGDYRPTVTQADNSERQHLADLYDEAQANRRSGRRARRY